MTGNADKRQQQADENRQASLKLASEQMQKAFLGDNGLLVDKILLAGPGNMKALLLKVLPQNLAKVTETMTVSRSGRSGLYDLAKMLEAEDEKLRKEALQQAKLERAQQVKSIRLLQLTTQSKAEKKAQAEERRRVKIAEAEERKLARQQAAQKGKKARCN
nr:uncharacterized protein LOC113802293 [Penaeus vannamei]